LEQGWLDSQGREAEANQTALRLKEQLEKVKGAN
jgi:hypothetical protein